MKKQSKKFAVLNVENSGDVLVMPLNMSAYHHIVEMTRDRWQDGNGDGDVFEYKALNVFNTDYEGTKWEALRRMGKPYRKHRYASIITAAMENTYYDSSAYLRLMDGDVKITSRFFDYIINKTKLKYITEGNNTFIVADDSLIPEGLTESYINKKKLVNKDEITEIYGDISNMRYHSQYHPEIEKQFTKFMDDSEGAVNFGFEAEKVDEDYVEKGIALQISHETGFKKELDGSLGSEGYELISPVLPLYNQELINDAIKPVADLLNAKTNNSCGGHFNISKNGVQSRDILKKIKGSLPLFYMMYEKRLDNRYCEAKNFAQYLRRPTKYSALYVKSTNILEIRLFPAIKNTRILQNRIELMRIIMGELYGLSAIKVVLKLADPSSSLHKYMLNILGGDMDKLVEKIQKFNAYSIRYGCGKISIPTMKKVNKLLNRQVFTFPEF